MSRPSENLLNSNIGLMTSSYCGRVPILLVNKYLQSVHSDPNMMKLSGRMKDILFILSKTDSMTRSDIICVIEGKRWEKITTRSPVVSERIPLDKVRVSYDRTLRRLRELGLIEGGFPSERPPLSPYSGTLWRGYVYVLTGDGRREAEEIVNRILKPLMRYSDMLIDSADPKLSASLKNLRG